MIATFCHTVDVTYVKIELVANTREFLKIDSFLKQSILTTK